MPQLPTCPDCHGHRVFISRMSPNWSCLSCNSFSCGNLREPVQERQRMCRDLGLTPWQILYWRFHMPAQPTIYYPLSLSQQLMSDWYDATVTMFVSLGV